MTALPPTDRDALDAQFNLRRRHPDYADIFARWARDSVPARVTLPVLRDLVYGPSRRQTVDLFVPPVVAPPLLAFVHGGYWQSMDKEHFSFLAPPFVARGIAVAMVEYDLAPDVSVAEIVAQVRRALHWLAGSAGRWGVDTERLVVAGHSAGGHLAAMAAMDPDLSLAGICGISGLYDLVPIQGCYLNDVLGMTAEDAAALSPVRLTPASLPPMQLAVGGGETDEYHRQQAALLALWGGRGLTVPGHDHFSILDALASPGAPLHEAVCALALNGALPCDGADSGAI